MGSLIRGPAMPADRLRRRLAELIFPLDENARTDVPRCVLDYADALKTQCFPPKRTLISLKTHCRRSRHTFEDPAGARKPRFRTDLMMDMVALSIERG
jgi:hypothetical protein